MLNTTCYTRQQVIRAVQNVMGRKSNNTWVDDKDSLPIWVGIAINEAFTYQTGSWQDHNTLRWAQLKINLGERLPDDC